MACLLSEKKDTLLLSTPSPLNQVSISIDFLCPRGNRRSISVYLLYQSYRSTLSGTRDLQLQRINLRYLLSTHHQQHIIYLISKACRFEVEEEVEEVDVVLVAVEVEEGVEAEVRCAFLLFHVISIEKLTIYTSIPILKIND